MLDQGTEILFRGPALDLHGVGDAGRYRRLAAHLGVPVLALGRYSSQAYADDVAAHTESQDRTAVLLYAGDFDPSGEDIDRDFTERTGCWDEVIRVTLTRQVRDYRLPVNQP